MDKSHHSHNHDTVLNKTPIVRCNAIEQIPLTDAVQPVITETSCATRIKVPVVVAERVLQIVVEADIPLRSSSN